MNSPFYYYTVLELPNDASLPEIKKAYKKKALQFHPDKCSDPRASEKFKEVNQAFHVLSDADKRRCYDSFGGVERPEIPIALTKPFEDFCEGIALGAFSVFANIGFMAIFGIPGGMGASTWMIATQLFTAWHLIPSLQDAGEISKWSKSLGAVLSPLFLVTTASCLAGYLLYSGGKLALDYTSTKIGTIGEHFKNGVEHIKNGVKYLQGRENLSLTLEDWVVLDDKKEEKLRKETKANAPSSQTSNSPLGCNFNLPSNSFPSNFENRSSTSTSSTSTSTPTFSKPQIYEDPMMRMMKEIYASNRTTCSEDDFVSISPPSPLSASSFHDSLHFASSSSSSPSDGSNDEWVLLDEMN